MPIPAAKMGNSGNSLIAMVLNIGKLAVFGKDRRIYPVTKLKQRIIRITYIYICINTNVIIYIYITIYIYT